MLRGFWAMVVKEFRQIRRDRVTMIFAILIPTIQLTIFGYAIRTDVVNVRTVLVDMSHSEASRKLVSSLNNTGVFKLIGYSLSYKEAYEMISNGFVKVAVIIPPDFTENPKPGEASCFQVLIDGSDSTTANYVMSTIEGVASSFSAKNLDNIDSTLVAPRVVAKPRMLFNPELKSSTFFVPALIVIILHMPLIMLTSLSIVRERAEGTLEQLIVTPITPLALMLGKLTPFFVIGILSGAVILTAMILIFKVPIMGNAIILQLFLILWIITSLAMGLLFSTVAKNQIQAVLMTILTVVPSILLSGFMFPRESMPALIYWITFLLPMTYAVSVVRGLVIRGASLSAVAPNIIILAFLCIFLITFATLRFQKRLG